MNRTKFRSGRSPLVSEAKADFKDPFGKLVVNLSKPSFVEDTAVAGLRPARRTFQVMHGWRRLSGLVLLDSFATSPRDDHCDRWAATFKVAIATKGTTCLFLLLPCFEDGQVHKVFSNKE